MGEVGRGREEGRMGGGLEHRFLHLVQILNPSLGQSAAVQGVCTSNFTSTDLSSPILLAGVYLLVRGKYLLTPK